jgi:UDP-N-acetylmuramyl pentapeptide phosphotransferase/UDP-N-acetylglucosamine-1-phosphate transferase
VLVASPGFATGRRLLVDAVLIALAANLGNLLDRAPGRTIKAAIVAYIPLALVLGDGAVGVAIAPVMGAAFALLPDDLGERVMLGDAGANVIGAVLGLGVVLGRGEATRTTALVVLIVANVAAELVSFSSIIDRVKPLRAIDRLGQRGEQSGRS